MGRMSDWDVEIRNLVDEDLTDPDNVAARIKDARLRAHIYQNELAALLNKSRGAVYQYETGAKPPLDVIVKLAAILDVTPEYLAFGVGAGPDVDEPHGRPVESAKLLELIDLTAQAALITKTISMPKALLGALAESGDDVVITRLTFAAPLFGIADGAWLFVNRSRCLLEADGAIHVMECANGTMLARSEPTPRSLSTELILTAGNGRQLSMPAPSESLGTFAGALQIPPDGLKFVIENDAHRRVRRYRLTV